MGSGQVNFALRRVPGGISRTREKGNVEVRVLKLKLYIRIRGRRAGQKDSADPCRGKPGSKAEEAGSKTHLLEQGDKLFLENLHLCWILQDKKVGEGGGSLSQTRS